MTAISITPTATVDEALTQSKLDWDVAAFDVQDSFGPVPGVKSLRRTDNNRHLSVVGSSWEPVQNRQLFEFLAPLVTASSAEWTTAGEFKGGRVVYAQVKISEADVLPGDPVSSHLMVANSHDGSICWRAVGCSVRVVCKNTFYAALSSKNKTQYALRHTSSVHDNIKAIQDAMITAQMEAQNRILMMRDLAAKPITDVQAKEVFTRVFELEDTTEGTGKATLDRLAQLFESGVGQSIAGVRGTKWAAFNAITEFLDHHARTRVVGAKNMAEEDREATANSNRGFSNVFGENARRKHTAVELLSA